VRAALSTDSHPAPAHLPTPAAVMARAGEENFSVASWVLPFQTRRRLLAIYGFARLADELGDAAPGDRLAALDWLQEELERVYAGRARHPLLVRLQDTLSECPLPREPFQRLIEANRVDQRVTRYETWEQLLGYCHLSADPVGELVLSAFGRASPERIALSDRICTALQLTEHWQDVAEDLDRGRIYLPREDLERFGCGERELRGTGASGADVSGAGGVEVGVSGVGVSGAGGAGVSEVGGVEVGVSGADASGMSWRVRGLLAFEVARTRQLLEEGVPLIGTLRGRERVALAAFVGGARAALSAIERAGYDVLAGPPRATRARRAAALVRTLAETGLRAKTTMPVTTAMPMATAMPTATVKQTAGECPSASAAGEYRPASRGRQE
jgi:squalene synthase HpnC